MDTETVATVAKTSRVLVNRCCGLVSALGRCIARFRGHAQSADNADSERERLRTGYASWKGGALAREGNSRAVRPKSD